MSEKQRWFFFGKLTRGEMKRPRNTSLDREWVERKAFDARNSEEGKKPF